jgi:hypothetical protein
MDAIGGLRGAIRTAPTRSSPTRGGSHEGLIAALAQFPVTIPIMVFAFILIVIIMFSIGLIWGLSMLIGIILILYAGIVLILNRGRYIDYMTVILISLGCFFIFLHTMGITFGVIDFGEFEIPKAIFNFFNPM